MFIGASFLGCKMAVAMVFRYVMHIMLYRAIAPLAYLGFVKKILSLKLERHDTQLLK